jgi:RNA-directed DNA polymerase
MRTLHNPDQFMRVAQFQILKNILEKVEVPEYIHAFEKKKTIPGMAAQHVQKNVVISVDLKDFFGSIKQYMIEEIFRLMGFGEKPARTLSELCTYKTFVPQGALTSPKLSNIVSGMTFGPPLKEYCDSIKAVLTIYADDITVSLDEATPELIAQIQDRILELVNLFGFKVNFEKQKVMYSSMRQYVCGVVVNEKVNLMKKERLKLRAIVHNVKKNGMEVEAAKSELTPAAFYSKILGKLNWFNQLNPMGAAPLIEEFKMYSELYKNLAEIDVTA